MTRLISGAVLAGAALGAIRFLPVAALRVVAVIVALAAMHEYGKVAGTPGASRLLQAAAVVTTCVAMSMGFDVDPVVVLLIGLAWVAAEVLFLGHTLHQAAAAMFAPVYLGVPLGMLVAVQDGLGWQGTLLLLFTIIVSDSAQYYTGRAFGRRPLAPTISPKKTVEGAIGGAVFGTAFMAAGGAWLFPALASPWAWSGVALAIVALGICGDLFESRLKRTAGLKDSSALIPGHGGILDRIDALLFATPAFYLFVRAAA